MSSIKHEQLEFLRIFRYAKDKGFIKRKRKTPMEASSSGTYFRLMYDVLKSIAINKNIFRNINRSGYYINFIFSNDIDSALYKLVNLGRNENSNDKVGKIYSNYASLQRDLRDIGGSLYYSHFIIANLNYFKFKLLIEFIDRLEHFCHNSLELLKEAEKEAEIEKQNKLKKTKELNKEINQKYNIVIPESETEAQRKFNLALAKYLENSNGSR